MGIFITFEGGEGCGKSTQARLLYDRLIQSGNDVLLTREPGGTELAEQLRSIVVKGIKQLDCYTELLIFMAARADHWQKCIKPALDKGKIVVCDRFQLSTLVYQCICGGCDIQFANEIYDKVIGDTKPDCTFIIDIEPSIGLTRSVGRIGNTELRFETKELSFHQKVREGYLSLADEYKCKVIDGSQSIYDIHEAILSEIKGYNLFHS